MGHGESRHDGTAGASARREHERRKARREERTRAQHPRVGELLLAVRGEPQHELAWVRGAQGEELVAAALAKRCTAEVRVLHDVRVPGSRANIDHLAIAPSGVWVVDSKRYKGKVEVRKPLLGAASLRVGGRDRTGLVEGLQQQLRVVETALVHAGADVPVRGAFCFVDSELPLLGTPSIDGLLLLTRRGLAKRLNATGPLTAGERGLVAAALLGRFRPA